MRCLLVASGMSKRRSTSLVEAGRASTHAASERASGLAPADADRPRSDAAHPHVGASKRARRISILERPLLTVFAVYEACSYEIALPLVQGSPAYSTPSGVTLPTADYIRKHGPLRIADDLPLRQRELRRELRCQPQQVARFRRAGFLVIVTSHIVQPTDLLEHRARSRNQPRTAIHQRSDAGIWRTICA